MADELALGSLNRARYAGLDFDTHSDDLRARLQVKYAADFNDFAISSLGIMLLDLTAYGLDTLSFYLDRRATDTYLSTARTRSSVARTCRQLGYKMGGAVASGVDLQVQVRDIWPFSVSIPQGFQFKGPQGLIFESAKAVLFTPAEQGILQSGKPIPCYEGETVRESFVSDGTPAQVFELRRIPDTKFVVQGTVSVTVDGASWEAVDLLEYGATDQFEVGFNDEPSTVRFGDGIAGNIPATGSSIVVTYVASRGKAGQVQLGTITEVRNPLVVAFTEIPLVVNNPEGSVGGDDRETLASAKAYAPKVWKSRQVAVTGEDYEALAGSYADPLFGRVAVAKALSSRSAATDLTVQNYLIAIRTAVAALSSAITSTAASLIGYLDAIDAEVTSISSDVADATTEKNTIQTKATSIDSGARSVKDSTTEISVDATDIVDFANDGITAVDAITTHATTSQLTVASKDAIKDFFNRIIAKAADVVADSSSAESAANGVIGDATDVQDAATTITTLLGSIGSSTTVIGTASSNARTDTNTLTTLDDGTDTAVAAAEEGINTHFDKVLSADCKANLVTVPILVRDAGGFYQAPSNGLIDSLQAYLDARKEVTQTVAVTSGENFLLPAVVWVRVGVLSGYAESVVKTAVESVIDGVLRDRKFGQSLYESDLDDVIIDVAGVGFVNARIRGYLDVDGVTVLTYSPPMDVDGNLITAESQIITRGTVDVVTEPYTT